jgi:signal transduction histidine kinase
MPDWDLDIDLSKLSALWIQLQTVKHLTFTSRHKLVSGEIIPVEITANYIRFNQHDLVAGYFREIRQRVEAEMELKKSRDLAEQVAKSKSEFLANMSHEIRTPMNAIIGLSQLALDRPMDDDLRKYVETIGDCSKSLLNILNNILEFSRLEAIGVKIEPAPFDLRQLIQQLSNLFQEAAHTKGLDFIVRIDPNIPEQLNGDAIRIQQILSNLLGNSIKFTQNGFVSLSVGLINLATPKISLNFVVSDSGIGISNENLAKLFKPFSQIDGSISRKFGGTGLGLAISRNLLQRMGGDFIINSTPNLGTCISFNLELTIHATENQELPKDPLPSKAGELAKYMQENGATLSGILVLVAEDNRINQLVICEYLKLAGVSTLIANNGQEVLDLLEHHPVKAILMDIQMPIMDGKQATRNIRNQAAYHHLPIIALTAGVTEEDKLSCLEAGIDDMIGKPIDPKKLIEVLKKCIFN